MELLEVNHDRVNLGGWQGEAVTQLDCQSSFQEWLAFRRVRNGPEEFIEANDVHAYTVLA
ncbi:hypothetical protein D1872_262990 [compost metagenome]